MKYRYHERQIKWDSWNYHKKEHWSLLYARGHVERCFGKSYNRNMKDSKFKFFWVGNEYVISGVGVLLDEKWIDKVYDIKQV